MHDDSFPGARQRRGTLPSGSHRIRTSQVRFYNLGSSLQFCGRFQEAQVAYRSCLALDSTYYKARSALSHLTRKTSDNNDIPALEAQLEFGGLGVDAELHLCHALAKEHEDLGNYQQAFRFLVRGKRRKRATIDYNFAEDRQLFEAARNSASAAARSRDQGSPSREPIFIVGLPRTGTTLVERILSSQGQVFAAGELPDFSIVLKRLAATDGSKVLDAETLRVAASMEPEALGEAYLQSTRPRTGHTAYFVDKMPLNFFTSGSFIAPCPTRASSACGASRWTHASASSGNCSPHMYPTIASATTCLTLAVTTRCLTP